MTTTTFQVDGMTCAHCERAVTEEVTAIAGVTGIEVSAATGVLTIESASAVDDALVLAAVEEAGYSAVRA
ncbi:heavy-metal-associated domain-containing protein [Leifsonia sp. TF02-11]|uniref:heavy-metal-associated domain-containing protein n=1 Tax=Leifsonia sp. TF02-11 TaxID=2815212 RepID=UPI001AA1546F|nr:heavy-metal-associated domain-containing protein [Leifsonia sp. TF02-11]MBO1738965.1 heavy-metal-associated domain-containing protein [Leifsonia sp. TF02-11]